MQQLETMDPLLEGELREGEQLRWWGRPNMVYRVNAPNAARLKRKYWLILAGLSLTIVINVLFAFYLSLDLIITYPSILIIFVTNIALSLILLRAFLKIYSSYVTIQRTEKLIKKTLYAITNQRVIVISTGQQHTVNSYTKSEIGRIERIEQAGGWGDIIFGKPLPVQISTGTVLAPARFGGVANVRHIETLLLKTFKNINTDIDQENEEN